MRRLLPEAEMMLSFFVAGTPVSKGSFKAFKNGGLVNANPKTKDWELRVAHECQQNLGDWTPCYEGAVAVRLEFHLARPKSLNKAVMHHAKRPDLDKLIRAVLDGLTGIAIKDDAQVAILEANKAYPTTNTSTGVKIVLRAL